jgi:hypothetical protein
LITGSSDGLIRAIDATAFLEKPGDLREKGYGAADFESEEITVFTDTLKINISVHYPSPVMLILRTLDGKVIDSLYQGTPGTGALACTWVPDAGDSTAPTKGYFALELASGQQKSVKMAYRDQ